MRQSTNTFILHVHGSRYKLYISHCMCSSTHNYVYTCTLENKILLSMQRVPPAIDGQKEYRCAHKTHQNTKQHTIDKQPLTPFSQKLTSLNNNPVHTCPVLGTRTLASESGWSPRNLRNTEGGKPMATMPNEMNN